MDTVHDILRTTWDDFYSWEQEDFHHTTEALCSPKTVTETPGLLPQWTQIQPHAGSVHDSQDTPESLRPWVETTVSQLSSDVLEIVEYRMRDGPNDAQAATNNSQDISFISVTLEMLEGIPSCPQYEACTPLDQNILLGDDPAAMAFLPFADDPGFDQMSYLDEYDDLSWRRTTRDPNWAAIIIAAWNSCTNHGLAVETIAEVLKEIFPLELSERHGLRDFPQWNHPLLNQFTPSDGDEFNLTMMQQFCRLCGLGYCFRHYKPNPLEKISSIDNTLGQELDKFCSDFCFLSLDPSKASAVETTWTGNSELLEILLSYLPDTTPCYLASISRKPCIEVFIYRELLLLSDEPTRRNERPHTENPPFTLINYFVFGCNTDPPCSHNGPCTERNCPCWRANGCTSRCFCDKKCRRRQKGCKCKRTKSKPACSADTKCPCFRNETECDPDICVNCQPLSCSGTCSNIQLQMGQAKRTSVRRSKWGFGLFMAESVQMDELIDEYVGEMIFDPTADSRQPIQVHRGRNYLFALHTDELNKANSISIDSSYAGNATRYINHAKRTKANCHARDWIVYGERRMKIIASKDIKAGEELLMNYGKTFFPSSPNENENVADCSSDETYKGDYSSGPGSP